MPSNLLSSKSQFIRPLSTRRPFIGSFSLPVFRGLSDLQQGGSPGILSDLMDDYVGTILNERYRVEQLLGEGGMGAVYLGRHVLIGKKVAIKFLHSAFSRNESVVRRFMREAKVTAEIGHANIVEVLDFGISPSGEPYLVMEYLEGESLSDLLKRTGPVSTDAAVGIMIPVLRALEAAHNKGVVHRDLKPDNIFVIPNQDELPTVKVIDFGISKRSTAEDEKLTQTGTILGTPAYMSPEQVRGASDLDHRTDLYAMGVILYEMLTGALPFKGQNYNEILLKVVTEPPRPASELNSDLPQEVLAIIDRALSKDPGERHQSAAEMIEALGALTNLEKRIGHLTQIALGATLHCIGGDVGEPLAPSSEDLAKKLISEMTGGQATAPAPALSGLRIVERGRKLAKDTLHWSRNHPRRSAGVVATIAFGLVISVLGPFGNPVLAPKVSITVEGVPSHAKIFYNDEIQEKNPFKVKGQQVVASVEVRADGYDPFQIWIVPSEDKTVHAELTPRERREASRDESGKKSLKDEMTQEGEVKEEDDSSTDSEVRNKKKRRSSGGFRGLIRRVKNKVSN